MQPLDDKKLVDDIMSSSNKARTNALKQVYEMSFGRVKHMVTSNGGTIEMAEDVFQDGISVLYQNLTLNKFEGRSSLHGYLFNICRYLFYKTVSKERDLHLNEEMDLPEEVEKYTVNQDMVRGLIDELKEGCRQILLAFYYQRKTMLEIAQMFNLGSDQAARTKKSRCMKGLVEKVKKKGISIEHFLK